MVTTINSNGLLTNDKPINGASNPHECHKFEHSIEYTDILESTESLLSEQWYLSGDVPVGLSIDNTGLISGRIALFMDQPSCQDNYPNEETKLDGSNWGNNGRYKHPSYTFNFKVHRKVIYIDTLIVEEVGELANEVSSEEIVPLPIELINEVNGDVSILVIKNNNVTNLIFVKKYLEAGHELKIGNDTYRLEDIDNYLVRHPGPFGCN